MRKVSGRVGWGGRLERADRRLSYGPKWSGAMGHGKRGGGDRGREGERRAKRMKSCQYQTQDSVG